MTETLGICENACRAFSFMADVWPILSGLGIWVGQMAPAIAIVWAVYAYFHKLKNERDAELRLERRKIYQAYLEALNSSKPERPEEFVWEDGFRTAHAIMYHHQTLALMAPDEVAKASLLYLQACMGVGGHFYNKENKPIKTGTALSKAHIPIPKKLLDELFSATKPMRDARKRVLLEMRKDLLKGTKVDPTLTDVDELQV
jgi:hypothetical protein